VVQGELVVDVRQTLWPASDDANPRIAGAQDGELDGSDACTHQTRDAEGFEDDFAGPDREGIFTRASQDVSVDVDDLDVTRLPGAKCQRALERIVDEKSSLLDVRLGGSVEASRSEKFERTVECAPVAADRPARAVGAVGGVGARVQFILAADANPPVVAFFAGFDVSVAANGFRRGRGLRRCDRRGRSRWCARRGIDRGDRR
jgi:hypothetical protein